MGSLFKELKCIESGDSICRLADEWVKTDSVKQMFTSNIYVWWLVKLLKKPKFNNKQWQAVTLQQTQIKLIRKQ